MVAEAAKQVGLPYVRFSAVFAEGTIAYGGEMTGTPSATLRLQPVFVTLGDYGNLLACRVIIHTQDQNPGRLADRPLLFGDCTYDCDKKKYIVKTPPSPAEEALLSTPGTELTFSSYEESDLATRRIHVDGDPKEGAWVGLRLAPCSEDDSAAAAPLPSARNFSKTERSDYLLASEDAGYDELPNCRVLPGGGDVAFTFPRAFFHLDSHGASCFTLQEAQQASEHLKRMEFLERVQARIAETDFLVPAKMSGSRHFCNEDV